MQAETARSVQTRLNRTFYGIETYFGISDELVLVVLIVPFMELKRPSSTPRSTAVCVLIVPFMELKHRREPPPTGRETVLIVPFMELKLSYQTAVLGWLSGLNRTFYGIETIKQSETSYKEWVLIVPFMELKQIGLRLNEKKF